MSKIEITETLDAGNDILIVRGTVDGLVDEAGKSVVVEARGWLSAMTNHVDKPQAEGEEAKPLDSREMTGDEKRAYCESLIAAALPQPVVVPKAVTLF